jgi:hypothetical protein
VSAGVLPRRTTCFGVASEMGTGYATLWNTFKRITAGCSHTEKLALYSGTAVACGFTPFLGFSYGFRPKLSQHDALDALIVGISSRKVNFILDADIAIQMKPGALGFAIDLKPIFEHFSRFLRFRK